MRPSKTGSGLGNVEIVRMASGISGELFKMSGLRNPCREGDPEVVKAGDYAHLLLVDGNPLDDLSAVTGSNHIWIITKDGKFTTSRSTRLQKCLS